MCPSSGRPPPAACPTSPTTPWLGLQAARVLGSAVVCPRVCRDIAVQRAIGPKFWDRVWFKVLSRVLFSSMYELCLDLAVGKAHAYLH